MRGCSHLTIVAVELLGPASSIVMSISNYLLVHQYGWPIWVGTCSSCHPSISLGCCLALAPAGSYPIANGSVHFGAVHMCWPACRHYSAFFPCCLFTLNPYIVCDAVQHTGREMLCMMAPALWPAGWLNDPDLKQVGGQCPPPPNKRCKCSDEMGLNAA